MCFYCPPFLVSGGQQKHVAHPTLAFYCPPFLVSGGQQKHVAHPTLTDSDKKGYESRRFLLVFLVKFAVRL